MSETITIIQTLTNILATNPSPTLKKEVEDKIKEQIKKLS